jgi:hypothetical protein
MNTTKAITREIPISVLRKWVDDLGVIIDSLDKAKTLQECRREMNEIWEVLSAIDDEYIEGYRVTK